jgi:hypothetical protein
MMLVLTAIDSHHQLREFSCPISQLEVGFDLLNTIVARGHALISAYIMDDNQSTSLPLEAFDGGHFLTAVQELQEEWQTILSDPPQAASLPSVSLSQWRHQRVRRYEVRVDILKRTLDRLQEIWQRARDKTPGQSTPSPVQSHYRDLIERCKVRLIKAQLLYQVALDRLNVAEG